MRLLRAFFALALFVVPPTGAALFARWLYELGWAMTAVIFLILFSLWAEGLRALRRLD